MCVKLNNLETVRGYFESLAKNEEQVASALENAFVLLKKVYHIFINMIIYVVCNINFLLINAGLSNNVFCFAR